LRESRLAEELEPVSNAPARKKSPGALDRVRNAGVVCGVLWVVAFLPVNERIALPAGVLALAGTYFAPAYIGHVKRNFAAILMVNLLLGWTVVGWIAALIWACVQDAPEIERGEN
jgi:hypothetical protein